mgnify:FL=1
MVDINQQQLINALEQVTLRTQDLSDRLDFTSQIARNIAKSLPSSIKSNDLLFASVNNLVGLLGGIVSQGLAFQKKTLGMNQLVSDNLAINSERLQDLPGDLFTKLESAFAFQAAGLDKVGTNTLDLSNRLKITGQDQKAFQRLVQQQIALGKLSQKDIEDLSEKTLFLSRKFEVQGGKLIESMNELSQNMLKFGVMGITKQVSDLTQSLGAQFPQISGELSKMINILADPSTPTSVLARLGAVDFAKQLRQGMITGQEGQRATLAIISKMARNAERFTSAARGTIGEVEQTFLNLIGPAGQLATVLQAQLGEGPRDAVMNSDQFMNDIGIKFNDFVAAFGDNILQFLGRVQVFITPLISVITFLEKNLHLFSLTVLALTSKMVVEGARRFLSFLNLNNNILALRLALNRNAAVTARAAARGAIRGTLASAGPMVAVMGVLLIIGSAMKHFAAANQANAEKELQESIAKAKERAKKEEVITSRFEALSTQILRDSIFRASMRESVVLDSLGAGFAMVTDAVKSTTDAVNDQEPSAPGLSNRGRMVVA